MDDSNISQEISSNQNSTGIIDHTCDENEVSPLFNLLMELMTWSSPRSPLRSHYLVCIEHD